MKSRFFSTALSVSAGFVLTAGSPLSAAAQTEKPLSERLAAIEKEIEAKRVQYGIPGLSLAIVQDDKVIFSKGFGLRDVATKKPVTPDTLFAIGSATKAFTAMSAIMLQDEGKLSLSDSPKKYLPYFKLRDPDTDAKITLRDLLCHNSGLPRTDVFWISNRLTREEAIRVLADVKPTAKLGEKFQYQNVCYTVAGEIASKVDGASYEKMIEQRILTPLGMKNTTLDVKKMQKSPDFSLGYDIDPASPGSKVLPTRNITALAPAGAINSSANEMTRWVRLMLGGGQFEGKRLVSENGYAQLVKPQMTIAGNRSYGLGWFLGEWHGNKVVEHGGNIDGFNAEVAMLPDKKIGFVLLTNVTNSPLGQQSMEIVWKNLVDVKEDSPAVALDADTEKKALADLSGVYVAENAPAAPPFTITEKEGKVSLIVAGQPPYPVAFRNKDEFGSPALPSDFSGTIRRDPAGKIIGILWKQPGVELALRRKDAEEKATSLSDQEKKTLTELCGVYRAEKAPNAPPFTIAERDGKISLIVEGQPPYPVALRSNGEFGSSALPPEFFGTIRRDSTGKIIGFLWKQPGVEAELKREKAAELPDSAPSADELLKKMVDALGGEATLRRHTSLYTETSLTLENQGLTATLKSWERAPNAAAAETHLFVLGKKEVGYTFDYFDGEKGGTQSDLQPDDSLKDNALETARVENVLHPLLDTAKTYKSVVVTGVDKVNGEDVYVITFTPEKADPIKEYVSTKTFLTLRRDTPQPLPKAMGGGSLTETTYFSDYRDVDGEKVPFRITRQSTFLNEINGTVTVAKFNEKIGDDRFKPRKK